MKIRIILVLHLLLLAAGAHANPGVIRVTEWDLLYSADASVPAGAGAYAWQRTAVPGKFRLPYGVTGSYRQAWLRGTFQVTDDPGRYHGIIFGRILHTYALYINNHFLDSRHEDEIINFYNPVYYILPHNMLVRGTNHVYVYIGIFGMEYGGICDNVSLLDRASYLQEKGWLDLIYNQLPLAIQLLMLLCIAGMLVIYLVDRKARFFLYTAGLLVINVLFILLLFSPFKPFGFDVLFIFQAIAIPVFGIFYTLIVESLYRIELEREKYVIAGLVLAAAGILALQRFFDGYSFYFSLVIGSCIFLFLIVYLTYLTHALNAKRPDTFKFHGVILLLYFAFTCGGIEFFLFHTGNTGSLLVLTYCSPFLILGFVILGARDYQIRMMRLYLLYDGIKGKKKGVPKRITDNTGDKINEIIQFINANYNSDLSREGLAAAVDMNPNYFSGKFKEYTGKKLLDYINALRIRQAAEKLATTDTKVIDIALSSGFDSLSTFNRLFKSFMGMTPTEYREKK